MKKEKRLKLYEEYMFDKGLTSIVSEFNIKKCEAFGYMDGFFNEHIYKELILEFDRKEYIETYNKYFEIGENDRLEDKSGLLEEEKKWFIEKLIVHDLLNNNYRDIFSEEYQAFYDDCMKYGITILSNGEIKLSKPKKQ